MFVKSDNPEFVKETTGNMPGDDGEAFSFRARFVALGTSEQKNHDMGSEDGTIVFLTRVLVGCDNIVDADKQPMPWSPELRDWLIDQPYARAALVRAYFGGVYEAKLGN